MNMKHISEPDPSNVDRVINTIMEGAIIGPSLFKGLTGVHHGMDGSRCSVFSFPLCLLMESLHSCHAIVQRALGVSSLNPFDAIGCSYDVFERDSRSEAGVEALQLILAVAKDYRAFSKSKISCKL